MERRYSPEHIAKLFGVTKGTVIGWCVDGTMPAVNVARASSKRARWRISEEDVETFKSRRQNKQASTSTALDSSRRTIARPTKDFFAPLDESKDRAKKLRAAEIGDEIATCTSARKIRNPLPLRQTTANKAD